MSILFSVCPHDTAKGLELWNKLKNDLEIVLKENIDFEPIHSFEEEEKNLREKTYHLYYASSSKAIELYKLGYRPIAKFKGQEDHYCIIGKDKSVFGKSKVRLATTFSIPVAYTMVILDFENIDLTYAKNYEEVLELLKEGKADIGFMYNETWEQIEDKKDIMILKSSEASLHHTFMAHPSVYEKLKPVLLSFDFLEEVSEEEFLQCFDIHKKLSITFKRMEEHEITRAVLSSKNVGIIIHHDKILVANEYAKNLLGYKDQELFNMSKADLVSDEYKETFRLNTQRRLRGEVFDISYDEVKFITKSGKTITAYAFSSTIFFRGKPSGILIFFDITKQKRFENMYAILREVNQAITLSNFEEEMFNRIGKALVDNFKFKLVWIGSIEKNSNYFDIHYKFGEGAKYLEKVKIPYKEDKEGKIGPSGRAINEDKIVVIPDTREYKNFAPWGEKAKEYGFISTASIPIKVNGKPKYVITMYSEEPEFFDEEIVDVLNEIKSDIEFALKRMNETRESLIIRKAIESSPSWMLVTDENFNIIYVNDAVSKISLYEKEELIGKHPNIFKSGLQSEEFYEDFYNKILKGESFSAVFVNKKKNQELFYLDSNVYPLEIASGKRVYINIAKDITREKQLLDEIVNIKNKDILTGLLNLESFEKEMAFYLKDDEISFLALIDVHGFTNINKNYGVNIGNEILKEIAKRLKEKFDGFLISRISSDEFGVFVSGLKSEDEIFSYIESIKDAFSKPIHIEGKEVRLGFHIGVSIYPNDGNDFHALYQNASVSLFSAKQKAENTIVYFDKDLERQLEQTNFSKNLVERALKENLFILYYQPFFDTKSLKLEGFEALVRIKDKDGTIYTPNFFIDFLEKSKYIFDFERWLIEEVSKKSRLWNIPISFNMSARTLKDDAHIEHISSFKANAIMEITERILLENPEKIKAKLEHIKDISSVKIAIDDFGTEYSSLRYISELPIDEIKIDISFTRKMLENKKVLALINSIIAISQNLGFKTLTEGVETKEQLEILRDMGCDYVQGYLLGKPMPEEEAQKLIYTLNK